MNTSWQLPVLLFLLSGPLLGAQQTCPGSDTVSGNITDQTGANIPGATITAAGVQTVTSNLVGHYALACISPGQVTLVISASGFETRKAQVRKRADQPLTVNLQLEIATVEQDVQVNGDSGNGSGAGTTVLNTQQVQQLPDDPDDLLSELQILASSGGGAPGSAAVVVDGFENSSALPPKSSIASIRINPDSFAPQFQWVHSRIEITTKPGLDRFHGALFSTDSNGIFNATNPFSTTATPAGRQRYGFELTGPILPKKLDFAVTLERRDITEFNIVNATVLDANLNQAPLHQAVNAPQRLWIGSARGDWQVSNNDIATLTWSANVNDQGNQGVGGLVLEDAGYASKVSEYDLRLLNTLTLDANTLHETRIGFSWKRTLQVPNSSSPNLSVAGYFTSGGATSQNLNDRERDLEVDDDILATRGKHQFNFGFESITSFVHNYDPNTFNGAYVFGGGSAPVLDANNEPTGQTATIDGMKQYRRALLGLPGGSPTTYQVTSGNPVVPLTQAQVSLYAQDIMKVLPRVTVTFGLRYQLEANPNSFANFRPRLGLLWSPDKKEKWTIGVHAGLFTVWDTPADVTEVERLNGSRQLQTTVYSPNYDDPLVLVSGSVQVGTRNQFSRGFGQGPDFQITGRVGHEFSHHWMGEFEYNFGTEWQGLRIININAPMVQTEVGVAPDPIDALLAPRPLAPNENIIQYENYGHNRGAWYALHLRQQSYKRFNLNATYWHLDFVGDSGDSGRTPQSSYSDRGESSRPDWMRRGGVSVLGSLTFPGKIELATQFSGLPGLPYNITTGTDANGDGNFNDRPAYTSGSASYSTRYGTMTVNTVNGNVPYNAGTMPGWVLHLNPNIQRVFRLNPKDKDHPLTLTFNARSSNVLNHTNVTAVNTILSSGTVGQPNAAEPARRVELGARFEF